MFVPRPLAASLVLLRSLAPLALSAEWAPAAGPLLTRWAKDVSPKNVHPEYPRPQLAPLAVAKSQRPVGPGRRR